MRVEVTSELRSKITLELRQKITLDLIRKLRNKRHVNEIKKLGSK